MKLFSPVLLLFLALPLMQQLNKTEKKVVGVWKSTKVDFTDMLIGISDEERAMYDAFLPMMEEAILSLQMTFNADGSYTSEMTMFEELSKNEGTWQLSADGKTLKTTVKESDEVMTVESISSKEMVLMVEGEGMKWKIFMAKQKLKKK
jgi:3,4-dihydroxy-2-butanone 4-phosphate synthase